MAKRPLGKSGLEIEPLVFGGNVFGWTVDEKTGFGLLDAFVDHGLNAIDTADYYSVWAPGNKGGESEAMIGAWLRANPGKRDKVLIFTKVGLDMGGPGQKGLSARWIIEEAENSLRRLNVETIDLYQSHMPDDTPHEETLEAYDRLIRAGKVRSIGASNFSRDQMESALLTAKEKNLPRYQTLQPHYNLCERAMFEGGLQELCVKEGLGVISYYSLASGFLTGKYRSKADMAKSPRGEGAARHMTQKGERILKALDDVAAGHNAQPAEVALAWIMVQPGVTAPIASATSQSQLASLRKAVDLALTAEEIKALNDASA